MSMRSSNSPRRIYQYKKSFLVCFGGSDFMPKHNSESTLNPEKEVRIEVLESSGGKKRIEVSQRVGNRTVKETWIERDLKRKPRNAAAA